MIDQLKKYIATQLAEMNRLELAMDSIGEEEKEGTQYFKLEEEWNDIRSDLLMIREEVNMNWRIHELIE